MRQENTTVTALLDLFLENYRKHHENEAITTEWLRWWSKEVFDIDVPNATLLYRLNQYVERGLLERGVSHKVKFEHEYYLGRQDD